MSDAVYSASYDHPLLAELYDLFVTDTDDVALLRRLMAGAEIDAWNALECFCGTGRILAPLAADGHRITGIEISPAMLDRAAARVAALGGDVAGRVALRQGDVLEGDWGMGYNLVVIGANALYELPSPDLQARCIVLAREALLPGGYLYVDNDDYRGGWERGPFGHERVVFEGHGAEGRYGRWSMENVDWDDETAVLTMRRRWLVREADGAERLDEYIGRKHPVSKVEAEHWLRANGFDVVALYGDRQGRPYDLAGGRAIFWARRGA
jgi:SAM-dependent methyltransferase